MEELEPQQIESHASLRKLHLILAFFAGVLITGVIAVQLSNRQDDAPAAASFPATRYDINNPNFDQGAIRVGANPAIDGLSMFTERNGVNPRNSKDRTEPGAPTGVRWKEHERFLEWINSDLQPGQERRELATHQEYLRNTHSSGNVAITVFSTWDESLEDAVGVIQAHTEFPTNEQGERAPLVLGVPLLLDPDPAETSGAITAQNLTDVANGRADEYFRELRKILLENNIDNAILRIGWEANCNCYPWGVTDPHNEEKRNRYIDAYRQAHDIMTDDSDGSQDSFEFGFDTIRDGWEFGKGQLLYPGDEYVDYIGMGHQDRGGRADRESHWENKHLPQLDAMAAFARERNKPMYIHEAAIRSKAFSGGGDNDVYFKNLLQWINDRPVAFYQIWNHWAALSGGPTKLYPTYCSSPTNVNVAGNSYDCVRKNTPESPNPLAAASVIDSLAEIESGHYAAEIAPIPDFQPPNPNENQGTVGATNISLAYPLHGDVISGNVELEANIADGVPVGRVEFFLNEEVFLGFDREAPYQLEVDTSDEKIPQGLVQLSAQIKRNGEVTWRSPAITVLVSKDLAATPPGSGSGDEQGDPGDSNVTPTECDISDVELVMDNIAPNYSFEVINENLFTVGNADFGWGVGQAHSGNCFVSISSDDPDGDENNQRYVTKTKHMPVFGNQLIRSSVWVKTQNVTKEATFAVSFWSDSTAGGFINGSYAKAGGIDGITDWTEISLEERAPVDAKFVRIDLLLDGDGTAYFDDLSVVPQ